MANFDWIQTYTGKKFFPLDPREEDVDIIDIAHALSNQCRYTGHTREFYSIAQHSVLVSYTCDSVDAFYGLLHDSAEAYICDLARPVKHSESMRLYRDAEKKLLKVILGKYGLNGDKIPVSVKIADNMVLMAERRDLMPPPSEPWLTERFDAIKEKIVPWRPNIAEVTFMNRFNALNIVKSYLNTDKVQAL